MKTRRYILFAMAALAFASCEKAIEKTAENEPSGEISTITFSATLDGKAPGSKAVIGTNLETGKPLNFWEDGDKITVYSQGKGDSGTHAGYTFSTTLGANASSADFTYTGDGWEDGSAYMAIYPATGSRAVNFTGDEAADKDTKEFTVTITVKDATDAVDTTVDAKSGKYSFKFNYGYSCDQATNSTLIKNLLKAMFGSKQKKVNKNITWTPAEGSATVTVNQEVKTYKFVSGNKVFYVTTYGKITSSVVVNPAEEVNTHGGGSN